MEDFLDSLRQLDGESVWDDDKVMAFLLNPEKKRLLLASKFVFSMLKFAEDRLLGEGESEEGE